MPVAQGLQNGRGPALRRQPHVCAVAAATAARNRHVGPQARSRRPGSFPGCGSPDLAGGVRGAAPGSYAGRTRGGQAVGQTCLWQVLAEQRLRRKKSLHATERDTPRVREARGQYVQAVPLKRGRSLTLIGALSVRGLHGVQLLSAPLNQHSFGLYISPILAPQLRRGHVLVLDNLRVHYLTGVREWLGKRGVEVVFLPPYSPDFSPIEQAWSKLKTKLRTAQARTEQALQAALHEAITWISSADARH